MSGTFRGLFRWVLGTWGKYLNIYYSNVIRSKVSGAPESFREGAAGGLLNVSGAPKSSREGAAEGLLKISRDWGGLGGFRVEIGEGLGRGLSSMSLSFVVLGLLPGLVLSLSLMRGSIVVLGL